MSLVQDRNSLPTATSLAPFDHVQLEISKWHRVVPRASWYFVNASLSQWEFLLFTYIWLINNKMIMVNLLNGLPLNLPYCWSFGWKENFGINFYDMLFSYTVDLKSNLDNHISEKSNHKFSMVYHYYMK